MWCGGGGGSDLEDRTHISPARGPLPSHSAGAAGKSAHAARPCLYYLLIAALVDCGVFWQAPAGDCRGSAYPTGAPAFPALFDAPVTALSPRLPPPLHQAWAASRGRP